MKFTTYFKRLWMAILGKQEVPPNRKDWSNWKENKGYQGAI